MLLSIITINYKTVDKTTKLVRSIFDQLPKTNFELIVVDNNSGKEEIKKLQNLRDELGFKLVISQENIGFGAGINFGSQMAMGDIFLLLNSDTTLNDKKIIEMAKFLKEKDNVGILGGRLIDSRGNFEKSAGKFLSIPMLFLMLAGGERLGFSRFAPLEIQKVDWVSGGFMMIKKDLFNVLGGFDEDYFMYVEDMDLCFRASALKSSTYYYPSSCVTHEKHGSSSRGFAIYNIYRSLLIFYKKNKGSGENFLARNLLFAKAVTALFLGRMFGRKDTVKTYSQVLQLF